MFEEIRYELWKSRMSPEEREETLTFNGWKQWTQDEKRLYKKESSLVRFVKFIVLPKGKYDKKTSSTG